MTTGTARATATPARALAALAVMAPLLAGFLLGLPTVSGQLPHSFRGGITVNGASPQIATTWVWAEIDGVLYGQDSTASGTSGGGYSGTEYALDVTGDQFEPADPKQGGVAGDTIVFWVVTGGGVNRYVAAGSATFVEMSSGVDVLNLAVVTADNPAWPLLSEVNPANTSNDWVELYNPTGTDIVLAAGWQLASESGETPIGLPAGMTIPAGGYSAPFNITDLSFLDDPGPAAGDVVKLTYSSAGLASGATIVVDRLEYGNALKPTDALGRAKGGGATACVPDIPGGCVWDVNVAGIGSGQALTPGRSFHRTVPADTDRYIDWTSGVPTPNWRAPGATPTIMITEPASFSRLAQNQAQTVVWAVGDADNLTAELSVWVNVSYVGPGGPWTNLYTGDGTVNSTGWIPNAPCTPGTDLPNVYLRGEVYDGNRNFGSGLVGPIRVDCTNPAVTGTVPIDNTVVAPNVDIVVDFSEAMMAGPTIGSFRLDGVLVPAVNITISPPETFTITHAVWAPGSAHQVDILCTAVDPALPNGNPLAPCVYNFNWTVTTANTNPSLSIMAPIGLESWSMNSPHNIAFTVSDGQDAPAQLVVDFEYGDGVAWFPIVTGRAGDQSPYVWTTPGTNCGVITIRGTVRDTGSPPLQGTDTKPNLTLDCTPPSVTATDPRDTDREVSVVKSVRITFSEPMDPLPTQASVDITPSEPPGLAFTAFNWDPTFMELTLSHAINFNRSVQYTITVRCTPFASAARDRSDPGNTLAGCPSSYTFRFTTTANNSAPEILLTTPVGRERWSGNTDHAIVWTMNDDNGTAALEIDVAYTTDGSTYVPIASNRINETSFIWLVPCFDNGTVQVNATVTDADLVPLQGYDESPPFAIDCTPATIASTVPQDNDAGVSTTNPIVIEFSEGINNVTLAGPCGVAFTPPVAGITYAWSNGNRTLTLLHGGLAPSTPYSVTVCNTIRDLSDPGLTLGGPNTFDFTTGTGGNTPPSVDVTLPAGGTFVRGQTISIAWTMSDAETLVSALGVAVTFSYNGGTSTGAIPTLTGQTSVDWTAPAIAASDVIIRVTITDGGGLTDSDTTPPLSIMPDTEGPLGSISGPGTATAGTRVTYACDQCSDNSGSLTYAWVVLNSAGQRVTNGTARSLAVTFPAAGPYRVNLTLSDPSGNTWQVELDVTVSQAASEFLWWILLLIVLALVLLGLFLLKRRKKVEPEIPSKEAETPPAEFPPPPDEVPLEFPPPPEIIEEFPPPEPANPERSQPPP